MNETLAKIFKNKPLMIGIAVVVIAGGAYAYHVSTQPTGEVKYVLGTAARGMFIASITGTGQVAGQSQIDVKPTVSAQITSIAVKAGQQVKKGDVIARLDIKDAQKTVRDASQSVHDAQISLSAANLNLQKLKAPPTTAALLQQQDTLNTAQRALAKLHEPPDSYDLQQAQNQVASAEQNARISSDGITPLVIRNVYDTGVSTLNTTMQTLTQSLTDADDILAVDNTAANMNFVNLFSVLDKSQKDQAVAAYSVAKIAIQKAKSEVGALSLQNADTVSIDAATGDVKDALMNVAAMLEHTSAALNASLTSSSFTQSNLDAMKSTMQSDRAGVSSKQSGIVSFEQGITAAKNTYASSGLSLQQAQLALQKLQEPATASDIAAAQEKVKEAQQALSDLKAGPTQIDIQLQQNSIASRQSSLAQAVHNLQDAQQALTNYTILAPIDGIVANVAVTVADSASPSTVMATIIGKQKEADITLNEVDVAKVKVGQKATLSFDAIDGLSIAGEVDEVKAIGTVSQGVVNYGVKVAFDTQDTRILSGMSVSASIIIQTDPDVVLVPNAAVKTLNGQSYVQLLEAPQTGNASSTSGSTGAVTGTPQNQMVEVGSSNDTQTEITSGLTESQSIVVQTIQPTVAKATAAPGGTNLLQSIGGNARGAGGVGGGNARFTTGR